MNDAVLGRLHQQEEVVAQLAAKDRIEAGTMLQAQLQFELDMHGLT